MPTADLPAPPSAHPFTLTIPGSAETGRGAGCHGVDSLEAAVELYERIRDESGEGAATFAPGAVTGPGGARWRISYNGRVQPQGRA
jgi:hypothetical protein